MHVGEIMLNNTDLIKKQWKAGQKHLWGKRVGVPT